MFRLSEERKDYEKTVEYYIIALSIFSELSSPDAKIAVGNLQHIRETIGKEQFDNYWKTITKEEVPDLIKTSPLEELERFIQYIIELRENGEQEDIDKVTEDIIQLLKEDTEPINQFFHLLLDYLSGKDISQAIQELKEPFKSILRKYMK